MLMIQMERVVECHVVLRWIIISAVSIVEGWTLGNT